MAKVPKFDEDPIKGDKTGHKAKSKKSAKFKQELQNKATGAGIQKGSFKKLSMC